MVGVLYRPPGKPRFIEYFDNSLKESDISNTQQRYLISYFNVNLLSRKKMLLVKKYYDSYSQASPLVKKYMDPCFSHSLHQLTAESTRTTDRTKTLIDHI